MTALQSSGQRSNGAAQGNGGSAAESGKRSKSKTSQEGTKVVIRRLPPGLTQDEFLKILGDNFKPKNGKVGWFTYVEGEVSSDSSEPSRPARAYLQILRQEDIFALEEAARAATWHDAKETWADPALVGPPSIEIPLYKKMPLGNKRADPRQGTIDTDPEYMAFLEAQTQPIVKKQPEEDTTADDEAKGEKVTPLVAFLREKKANKAKEAASTKAAKHARQGSKGKTTAVEDSRKKKGKEASTKADKAGELPKDIKILTKKATADAVEAAKTAASQVAEAAAKKEATPKSRRAGIAAIAKTLQRDLGLSPGNAHRKARQQAAAMAKEESGKAASAEKNGEAATARPSTPSTSTTATTSTAAPTAPKAQAQTSTRGRGKKSASTAEASKAKPATEKTEAPPVAPKILLKKRDPAPTAPTPAPAQPAVSTPTAPHPPTGPKAAQSKGAASGTSNKKNAANAAPTPGATRAFVKHANAIQGVTETLLKEALTAFGEVTLCEIDRRKGFAYVDFAEHAGLAKAIAASPVSVAQSHVQVLERKDREPKKAAQAKGATAASPAASTASNTKENAAPQVAAAPPTTPAAEKSAAEQKRGSRRRGGRNRVGGGDSSSKEAGGGSSGASKGNSNVPAAPGATASATAG